MSAATGVALAALSAAASSTAHAKLKSDGDKIGVLLWAGVTEFLLALPFVVLCGLPPSTLWPWLFAGMILHAIYYGVLIWSYTISDYSLAYPVARGVIPIVTTLGGIMLLGDRLSANAVASIILICGGILLLSMRGGLTRKALGVAMLCGLVNAAFTLVDTYAMRIAPEPGVFLAWYYLLDGMTMPLLWLLVAPRQAISTSTRRAGVMTGMLSILAFMPALLAARYIPVGAVSAIRISSILFSLFIGRQFMQEALNWRKLTGALAIMIGAIALISSITAT